MDELRSVVTELNKPPFSKGLTLVSLDEKSSTEILQLIIDILSEMDLKMKWDVKHEPKDAVVYAITDFVAMLNYKPAIENRIDFQAQLADGIKYQFRQLRTDIRQIIVEVFILCYSG